MRRLNAGFGVGISFGAIVLSALAGCGGSELDPASSASSPAPSPVASAPNVIKIVSSLPRTGSANAQTTTICNGIKMAIDEIGGTIHTNNGDFTIAYEDWDDASPQRGNWDPAVEAANSDKAIKDADIMA